MLNLCHHFKSIYIFKKKKYETPLPSWLLLTGVLYLNVYVYFYQNKKKIKIKIDNKTFYKLHELSNWKDRSRNFTQKLRGLWIKLIGRTFL